MFMEKLLVKFRLDHESILQSITEIQPLSRAYLHVKPKLRELFDKLLGHLEKQNNAFFEKLKEPLEGDHHSLKMIEFLSFDTKELKIKTLMFLDKYSVGSEDFKVRNFSKDFLDFSQGLISRIRMEEEYLFPLLEKIIVKEGVSKEK